MIGPEPQEVVKRKREGAPRWMWTFADLMSLLFALFVLLLTFADFDPRKFSETMGAVKTAFDKDATADSDIVQGPHGSGILHSGRGRVTSLDNVEELEARQRLREKTFSDLRDRLWADLSRNTVSLDETDTGIVLRFPSSTAFASGGADLSSAIMDLLDRITPVLKDVPGQIEVSGHTDDIPITTDRYRSNWDLSTARAVSVVHYLMERGGLDPGRLAASGYADSRPLAPNTSEEGRSTNRRVEIRLTIDATAAKAQEQPLLR